MPNYKQTSYVSSFIWFSSFENQKMALFWNDLRIMTAKRSNQPSKVDPTGPMKQTEKENDPTRIEEQGEGSNSSSGGKQKNDDYKRNSKIKIGK